MNNLYGHAMSQYLPCANFKWVKNIDKIEQKLMNIKSISSTGYTLKVDLEYSQKIAWYSQWLFISTRKN